MRMLTIVFDEDQSENMTGAQYADLGNGVWGVLKLAYPNGGFHLQSDGQTP